MEKICIIEGCHQQCDKGRRYCHRHYLDRKAAQTKSRKDAGLKYRTIYTLKCQICGSSYNIVKKRGSKYCPNCRTKIANFAPSSVKGGSDYNYSKNEYKTSTLEHRCIATKVIGRKLTSADIVHHIDGNTRNNKLENLLFLSNKKHIKLHQFLNEQLYIKSYRDNLTMEEAWDKYCKFYTDEWIFNNKDDCVVLSDVENAEEKVKISLGEYKTLEINNDEKIRDSNCKKFYGNCEICGKELKYGQTRFCSYECYNKMAAKNIPSKEELIKIIKAKTSLLQVAKHYNVSDNNVRKWLKKYGIDISDYGYRKFKIKT